MRVDVDVRVGVGVVAGAGVSAGDLSPRGAAGRVLLLQWAGEGFA